MLLFSFGESSGGSANKDLRITGYIFSGNLDGDPSLIQAEKMTHINYAFANIINGRIVEGILKILLSVGGWSCTGGFSDAALTGQSREIFANSAIDFLQKHNLNGIDLDREYPGQAGAGNTFRPEDREISLPSTLYERN